MKKQKKQGLLKPKKIERDNKEQTLAKAISRINFFVIGISKAATSLRQETVPISLRYLGLLAKQDAHSLSSALSLDKTDQAFLRRSSEGLFPLGSRAMIIIPNQLFWSMRSLNILCFLLKRVAFKA